MAGYGRKPQEIRRAYNVSGRIGPEADGHLDGNPQMGRDAHTEEP